MFRAYLVLPALESIERVRPYYLATAKDNRIQTYGYAGPQWDEAQHSGNVLLLLSCEVQRQRRPIDCLGEAE